MLSETCEGVGVLVHDMRLRDACVDGPEPSPEPLLLSPMGCMGTDTCAHTHAYSRTRAHRHVHTHSLVHTFRLPWLIPRPTAR